MNSLELIRETLNTLSTDDLVLLLAQALCDRACANENNESLELTRIIARIEDTADALLLNEHDAPFID